MKRNVFQRTKIKIVDWFCGVETDIWGNPVSNYPNQPTDDDDGDCDDAGSSWSTYSMLGFEPDWAEEVVDTTNRFQVGQTVHVVFKIENIAAAYLHMAMFTQQTGIKEGYHIAVRRYTDSSHDEQFTGTVMVSDAIKPAFDEWFATYTKRVTELERVLPVVVEGDEITGIAVEFKGRTRRKDVPDDKLFQEWLWINENCEGKVVATQKCWIFSDQTDAVKYKLTNF